MTLATPLVTGFPVSRRTQNTGFSSTAAVVVAADKLRAAGIDVIDLGVGEPDFPTPAHIKEAAKLALDENFTKYTSSQGTIQFRRAVADSLNSQFGSDYQQEQVCAVVGGKQGIFNAVVTLIDPGDDVLIEKPSWVSFPEIVHFAEGNVVWMETEATDFHLTAEHVKASITPKTKLLILNSPSNPTGRVIAPAELRKIAELAVERNFWIISDECYLQFVYAPAQVNSAASLPPELRARVLIVGSMSKTYAMTGWRIGYTVGPREWIAEILKIQTHTATHPASISQRAAIAALTSPQDSVREMLGEYQRRGEWLLPALNAVPGIHCSAPEGAFYAFPNVKALMKDCGFETSKALTDELLYKYGVVVTDGAAFGAEGYLRMSYATSLDRIQEAVKRILQLVEDRHK